MKTERNILMILVNSFNLSCTRSWFRLRILNWLSKLSFMFVLYCFISWYLSSISFFIYSVIYNLIKTCTFYLIFRPYNARIWTSSWGSLILHINIEEGIFLQHHLQGMKTFVQILSSDALYLFVLWHRFQS